MLDRLCEWCTVNEICYTAPAQKRATFRPKAQFMNQKNGTRILLRQLKVVAKYAERQTRKAALPVALSPPVLDLS